MECKGCEKGISMCHHRPCFGTPEDFEAIIDAGVVKLSAYDTIFSNGSCVTDRKFGVLSSNGNILTI
jgi:hypothetical protein